MNPPNDRSSGQLASAGQGLPPTDVDCSGWQRAAGPRSRGKLVGAATQLPPVAVGFIREPAVWLEVLVSFDAGTPPVRVMEYSRRLIAAAGAIPDLGLTYDFNRSRAENDDVVIALSPTVGGDVEKRLNEAAAVIRRETAQFPDVRKLVATVARAA